LYAERAAAFIRVPKQPDRYRIGCATVCRQTGGGTGARDDGIGALNVGRRTHTRSAAHGRRRRMLLPTVLLESYTRSVIGGALTVASGLPCWRVLAQARGHLV